MQMKNLYSDAEINTHGIYLGVFYEVIKKKSWSPFYYCIYVEDVLTIRSLDISTPIGLTPR